MLLVVGVAKLVFGVLVGAIGVFLGSRVLGRILSLHSTGEGAAEAETSAGIVHAAALVSLGLFAARSVEGAFTALDFLLRREAAIGVPQLALFVGYAVGHASAALLIGAVVLAAGALLFTKLTRNVDEVAQIKKGHLGSALVLGAVMIVMALVTAPGLETLLTGLVPLPDLPSNEMRPPN